MQAFLHRAVSQGLILVRRLWMHPTTRAVLCAAILFYAGASIDAQEAPKPAETPEAEGDTEAPSLVETTLALDIQTADYYELIAWCRQLGLAERGARKDLQNRLYAFYGIKPSQEPAEKPGTRIVVESARSTENFTIDRIDESYLRLAGGIKLPSTVKTSLPSIASRRTRSCSTRPTTPSAPPAMSPTCWKKRGRRRPSAARACPSV